MGSRGVGKRRAIRLEEKSCLSTELASVLGVLGDLSLLDDLTEGGTITSTVLTGDTDLGGSATLGFSVMLFILINLHSYRVNILGDKAI